MLILQHVSRKLVFANMAVIVLAFALLLVLTFKNVTELEFQFIGEKTDFANLIAVTHVITHMATILTMLYLKHVVQKNWYANQMTVVATVQL